MVFQEAKFRRNLPEKFVQMCYNKSYVMWMASALREQWPVATFEDGSLKLMVTFILVVTSDFWDTKRHWPAGCRPVIFSTDMVMKNAGTVQVPVGFAHDVERLLRENPHVLSVERVPLLFPQFTEDVIRRAA